MHFFSGSSAVFIRWLSTSATNACGTRICDRAGLESDIWTVRDALELPRDARADGGQCLFRVLPGRRSHESVLTFFITIVFSSMSSGFVTESSSMSRTKMHKTLL